MNTFIFEKYYFNETSLVAEFHYSLGGTRKFIERVSFSKEEVEYDREVLDRALFLAFILIGTSYYKTFPTMSVEFKTGTIDTGQAEFLNKVYQEGMSQFAFENNLTRNNLAQFTATTEQNQKPITYDGEGILSLQSGGKDSLLTASLLNKRSEDFSTFYISSTDFYPEVLNELHREVVLAKRLLDREALTKAKHDGGLNGHVPVTYIVFSIALLQAILLGKSTILSAIGHEGEEAHTRLGDLPVNHQWSKTWPAEQLFSEYVSKYISNDIKIGSPLRQYSELKVAELFVEHCWETFGHSFSSCNKANYEQGHSNTTLTWCGECPKCANSYLLFAPFIKSNELQGLFNGQDLFAKPSLEQTFKGLLGIDEVMKPFECVGEINELRLAYHKAQQRGDYGTLSFEVPTSDFNYLQEYPAQSWASDLLR